MTDRVHSHDGTVEARAALAAEIARQTAAASDPPAAPTVTFTVGIAQARFLIALAPRRWDPGVAIFTPIGDSGRTVRVTMDHGSARAAVAQLNARGDHRAAARVRSALGDA